MNDRPIIYGEEQDAVLLPLRPGKHTAKVTWTLPEELGNLVMTPPLSIPSASNLSLNINMPRNRWILFVRGPAMGPAVLFWGMLLVIAVVASFLGVQGWSPLRSWEWFLLGAGAATSYWPMALLIVAWFFLLSHRQGIVERIANFDRLVAVHPLACQQHFHLSAPSRSR